MSSYVRIIPMLSCMGMIFFMSHQPGDSLDLPLFPGADKLAHMAVYALLSGAVICAFSSRTRSKRRYLVLTAAILVPMLFGISDEYHQSFVAGRSSEFFDVVADAAGALLVSIVWFVKTSK